MANRIVSLKDYELYLLKFRYHFYLLLSEGMRMPWCVGGVGGGQCGQNNFQASVLFLPCGSQGLNLGLQAWWPEAFHLLNHLQVCISIILML